MKMIELLAIVIALVSILAAGCVNQNPPEKCVCPVCPSLNATNATSPDINVTVTVAKLKGPLRIALTGYDATLPVTVDNVSAGTVTNGRPLDLMVDEGNHTIKICVGLTCIQEYADVVFAKRTTIDFGESIKKSVEFITPTARIAEYYRSGDGISVIVEFINPSSKDLSMSAEVSVGYSYISGRTDQRGADSTRGKAYASVKAGQRETDIIQLQFADGYAYMFDSPVIGRITAS
jgi:hypothetical protein